MRWAAAFLYATDEMSASAKKWSCAQCASSEDDGFAAGELAASRGCTDDLEHAIYPWSDEYRRCPIALLRDPYVSMAMDWWQSWELTGQGPMGACLAGHPAHVRESIEIFAAAKRAADAAAVREVTNARR